MTLNQMLLKLKPRLQLWPATRMARKRARTGLLYIAPWLIGFLLLKLTPILASLVLSFTNFNMLRPRETQFIGLVNYARFLRDQAAGFSLFSTLAFALIAVPLQLGAALGLAELFSGKRLGGKQLHRMLIFVPSIIPVVAIASIWNGFLNPDTGWLNQLILTPLGLPPYPGPQGESGRNLLLTVIALWSIGPGFLIMLGAMHGVPPEVYEAARVDGAGPLMRFLKITVPIISPAIFFSLIINLIGAFGGAALLDRSVGFRGNTQSAFDGYVYSVMFRDLQLGYAASLAWVMFVIMLGVTLVLFATARYWVYYAEEA